MQYQLRSLSRVQLAKFVLVMFGTRSSARRARDSVKRTFEEDDRSDNSDSETDSSVVNSVNELCGGWMEQLGLTF